MDLKERLYQKLEKEGRTKKWFVNEWLPDIKYPSVMQQILGYYAMSDQVCNAIKEYLGDDNGKTNKTRD